MDLAAPTSELVRLWQRDWALRSRSTSDPQQGAHFEDTTFAIRIAGREIGVVALEITETANLIDLWLMPGERGHGYARRAISAAEDLCRRHGARNVRVAVRAGDSVATVLFSHYALVASHLTGSVAGPAAIPEGIVHRPMRATEFPTWRDDCVEEYAQQSAYAYGLSPAVTRPVALRAINQAIPDGVSNDTNEIWVLEAEAQTVATLWLRIDDRPRQVYIQNIETLPAHRRKGYAQASMTLAQERAHAHSLPKVRLNVFAHNLPARRLYDRMGYETAVEFRIKDLPPE